jgi:nicotinate-nucleotide adenylyltransferase
VTEVVGVLGGTFDPVHFGHLHVADAVRQALALHRMLLMPAAVPPHKTYGARAGALDRLAMVRLAVAGRPWLEASSFEIDRGGVCYTIDTLRALREEQDVTPLFVVGMDALEEVGTWRDFEALLREFDFAAVDRPGGSIQEAARRLGPAHAARVVSHGPQPQQDGRLGSGGRIYHLPIPLVDVSSSLVRARAAAGQSLLGLVPPLVAAYIRERRLYAEESAR